MSAPRHILRSTISIVGGVVLLGIAFAVVPGLPDALQGGLIAFGPWWASAIVALTFAITVVTALKWRLVARASIPDGPGSSADYVYFVSISAVAGLVLPRQFGVIGSRAASLKHKKIADIPTGLQIVFSDLASDLMVPVVLFGPSLLYVIGAASGAVSIALSAALLAVATVTAPAWQSRTGAILEAIRRWTRHRFQHHPAADDEAPLTHAVARQPARTVFLLAVAKVGLIILRAWLVARAADLPIGFGMLVVAFPVVQLAFLVGITPGGLGIADWSWIGVLGAGGVPLEDAATFALLLRLATTAAAVMVFSVLWALRRFTGLNSGPHPRT